VAPAPGSASASAVPAPASAVPAPAVNQAYEASPARNQLQYHPWCYASRACPRAVSAPAGGAGWMAPCSLPHLRKWMAFFHERDKLRHHSAKPTTTPTPGPTNKPQLYINCHLCGGHRVLEAIASDECPTTQSLAIHALLKCNDCSLKVGHLCEGSDDCGTVPDMQLDNCGSRELPNNARFRDTGTRDVFRVRDERSAPPTPAPAPAAPARTDSKQTHTYRQQQPADNVAKPRKQKRAPLHFSRPAEDIPFASMSSFFNQGGIDGPV
jgi:hypothetical protein